MESNINKTIVRECYQKIIRDLDLSLVDTYVREDYIQHSPTVPTGKEGLLQMLEFLKTLPKPAKPVPSPIIRVIGDRELVAVHLDINFMGKRAAVIDLFRLENGQLAEHWDASQYIPNGPENLVTMTNGATVIDEAVNGVESKRVIERLYIDVQDNGATNVLNKYLSDDFVEHNLPNALPGVLSYPLIVHHILAEGNFVVAHYELSKNDKVFSHFSIFRVSNGKIAEHWSVAQEVPETMAHDNGMF